MREVEKTFDLAGATLRPFSAMPGSWIGHDIKVVYQSVCGEGLHVPTIVVDLRVLNSRRTTLRDLRQWVLSHNVLLVAFNPLNHEAEMLRHCAKADWIRQVGDSGYSKYGRYLESEADRVKIETVSLRSKYQCPTKSSRSPSD